MYLKHPLLDEDGTLTVATPQGPRELPMIAGVVEWPDDVAVPIHQGQPWAAVEAPAALKARKAEEERALLAQLAAKHGFVLLPPDGAAAAASADTSAAKGSRKKGG